MAKKKVVKKSAPKKSAPVVVAPAAAAPAGGAWNERGAAHSDPHFVLNSRVRVVTASGVVLLDVEVWYLVVQKFLQSGFMLATDYKILVDGVEQVIPKVE